MRAATYLRISQDSERKGLGVDRQRALCRDLIQQRGWQPGPEHEDNDRSAYKGKHRPRFEALLRAVKDREVDVVVAYSVDRLARSLADLERVISAAEEYGVQIVTVAGDLDMSRADGRMVARILGSVAAGEVEKNSERTRSAIEQRVATGQVHNGGMRPYGYTVTRDELVPTEAEVIREIASRLLAGESLTGIARDLNRRGVDTGHGVLWRTGRIRDVMGRPRLCGRVVHRGQVVPGVVGEWPKVLDEDTFDRVQVAMAARRRVDDAWTQRRRHLLSGSLLRCGTCGAPVHAFMQSSGVSGYRCRSHVLRNERNVDEHVRREVTAWALAHPVRVTEWTGQQEADLADQIAGKEARIAELVAAFADGTGSAAVLKQATARLEAEIDGLRAQQVERVVYDLDLEVAQFDLSESWGTMSLDECRAAVQMYVERVVLHPSKRRGRGYDESATEIVFRNPDRVAFRAVIEG